MEIALWKSIYRTFMKLCEIQNKEAFLQNVTSLIPTKAAPHTHTYAHKVLNKKIWNILNTTFILKDLKA